MGRRLSTQRKPCPCRYRRHWPAESEKQASIQLIEISRRSSFLFSKSLPRLRTIPLQEVLRRHPLLPLRLNFQQLKRATVPTANEQMAVSYQKLCCSESFRSKVDCRDAQSLSTKSGERPRPRLKPAQPVVNFLRTAAEINSAVFFFQDRSQRRVRIVLFPRMNCPGLKSTKGFDHQVGADHGQL